MTLNPLTPLGNTSFITVPDVYENYMDFDYTSGAPPREYPLGFETGKMEFETLPGQPIQPVGPPVQQPLQIPQIPTQQLQPQAGHYQHVHSHTLGTGLGAPLIAQPSHPQQIQHPYPPSIVSQSQSSSPSLVRSPLEMELPTNIGMGLGQLNTTTMASSPGGTQFGMESTFTLESRDTRVDFANELALKKGSSLGLELGDFEILETLGTGTFGRVLLTRIPAVRFYKNRPMPSSVHPNRPAYFAIKVLEKSTVVRLKQIEHLKEERRVLSILGSVVDGNNNLAAESCPFLVTLHCTFQDSSNLYLLLDYIQGGELFSHLRRAGRFSADVARFYASNLILALEWLHARDVVYRDLKPENLLIDRTGYLKLTDFGFAKYVPDRTYTLCGTPEYLAPEIIQATGHGKAADYWALGVLLFELLSGYPPFFADNPLEIYEKILRGKISFPPHIDYVAKDLIKRLLTKDLSMRLGNLRDGVDGIKRHLWFEGVDWERVEKREIRAPIVPNTRVMGDTSNFERYPEVGLEALPGIWRTVKARELGVRPDEVPVPADEFGYLFDDF